MTTPRPDTLNATAHYLATGDGGGLHEDEQGRLDHVRGLLANAALWTEPPPGLVETIVDRIHHAAPRLPSTRTWDRRPRRAAGLVGLVAAAALVVLALLTLARPTSEDADITEVALTGTELAPGASATAHLRETTSGVAITLDVDGLGPASDGYYYQAWVNGPAGSVAIGTFHVRDGDDEPVELWSGVATARYPELTVTLEPEDGDPTSSRRRVLAGTAGG